MASPTALSNFGEQLIMVDRQLVHRTGGGFEFVHPKTRASGLITWLLDGDWWYALIIVVAVVIGAIIANILRSRRS